MEEDSVMASAAEEGEAESRRRPRDLLRRLGSVGNCCEESAEANGADSDEIELSLGLSLSLGGCFVPDSDSDPNPNLNLNLNLNPKGKIKLSRSSSLASFSPFAAAAAGDNASSLVRTCSLPTETEEELRKRKEMQSLKRLQAKRKRLERRNSIKSAGSARDTGEDCDPIPIPIPISFNGCRRHLRILTSRPPEWPFPPTSQASSVGSQGSCSFSSAADFEIKAPAAAAAAAAEGNDSSFEIQPLPDNINHKIAATPPAAPTRTETNCSTGQENPIRTLSGRTDSVRKNIMEDMPCVSTKGDGPNGRRIEGFLFKFEKVEDLRIVCVCHGSFLTPAEFVKHAGGGDVAHPLKHIVVNPSPSSLLS